MVYEASVQYGMLNGMLLLWDVTEWDFGFSCDDMAYLCHRSGDGYVTLFCATFDFRLCIFHF